MVLWKHVVASVDARARLNTQLRRRRGRGRCRESRARVSLAPHSTYWQVTSAIKSLPRGQAREARGRARGRFFFFIDAAF